MHPVAQDQRRGQDWLRKSGGGCEEEDRQGVHGENYRSDRRERLVNVTISACPTGFTSSSNSSTTSAWRCGSEGRSCSAPRPRRCCSSRCRVRRPAGSPGRGADEGLADRRLRPSLLQLIESASNTNGK